MAEVTVRPQEQLLIDALGAFDAPAPHRILCTSQGLGQLAEVTAKQLPSATVVCHWLDLYRAELARTHLAGGPENLDIVCSSDFPADQIDLAVLPLSAQGEAELTRDLLQEAHERLVPDGFLMVSTDNPRDQWLHGELRELFASVSRREHAAGTVYQARKTTPLARRRNFASEFAFRDRERLIHLRTRPGVFAHRKVDPGARQLMAAIEIEPGDRVLEIGCGSGAVSLAAAFRAEGVSVLAIDSNARAVECTAWAAQRNAVENLVIEHSATGPHAPSEPFDVVIANPPYYAGFRIAQFFLETAQAAMRKNGRMYVVSKQPEWYEEHMPRWFNDVTIERSKDYWVARGRR